MLHYSPGFTEVGVFDTHEADLVALDIDSGVFDSNREQSSGRAVVQASRDVDTIFQRISLVTLADVAGSQQQLRSRVCSQDLAEINTLVFSGLPWHIDAVGSPLSSIPFDFNFGSSSHPTEAFEGSIDLTDAYNFLDKEYKDEFDEFPKLPSLVFRWAQKAAVDAINESVEKGNGQFVTAEPGVLYRVEPGAIHRMQPFDPDTVYPVRFSIDQYLIG